ncbi:MAG: hypothetical protein H8D96_16900 [Desulfobacterales bacterium]|uniref:Uncharacterized protein n=1 Tax=Candidatus Desulfatibia vada TaxID=2841696 RepID=A0A8J6NVX8_9BACT|nr:hypothetical protein [Candidatus Desulfatibia vada]
MAIGRHNNTYHIKPLPAKAGGYLFRLKVSRKVLGRISSPFWVLRSTLNLSTLNLSTLNLKPQIIMMLKLFA